MNLTLVEELKYQGIQNPEVLKAIAKVPRAHFIPMEYRSQAEVNTALPISCGQTISQPYIVAYMTEQLMPVRDKKILEIGTGSGYQAAILAYLGAKVYSVERIAELAQSARIQLDDLGMYGVQIKEGDGSLGWSENSPYDAVIVTAASQSGVPKSLVAQLKIERKMIIPILDSALQQEYLYLLTKKSLWHMDSQQLIPVRFVPLIVTGDS
ncbi:MAG: protein-L-isoaspartate(D-aspartate) O-methyltransferase [Pseudomonadota bacterium]|nr:protein-L-isoaspartate(D-aspartate) O-methyltransferase [Pseudomonadota bacterium]